MAVYEDREAFIPFRKADVIEMCLEDGKLDEGQQKQFKEFCEILGAFYHFDFHDLLEKLKDNFAPFNPDADTKPRKELSAEQVKNCGDELSKALSHVLEKANYKKLTQETIDHALEAESLITLNMDVDFEDYDQMVCYHRGEREEVLKIKEGIPGFKKEKDFKMDIFERVVLLLQFKNEEHFKSKGMKVDKLNFTPGKMYLYMYKNIPKADLEVVFPNVQISMNLKDKLMLGIPAGLGFLAMIPKILPTLSIVFLLAVSFFSGKKAVADGDVMQGVIAALSLLAVLGGFAFKQYVKFKNKMVEFLKDVSDTLFFKNLDSNAGVFNMLIDAAEEEECKECILAYYHLLTHPEGLDQEKLDDTIETWFEEKHDAKIDFDVEKALAKLENMKGKVVGDGQDEDSVPEIAILSRDADGVCKVISLDDSKTVIDYAWDNFFQYN